MFKLIGMCALKKTIQGVQQHFQSQTSPKASPVPLHTHNCITQGRCNPERDLIVITKEQVNTEYVPE